MSKHRFCSCKTWSKLTAAKSERQACGCEVDFVNFQIASRNCSRKSNAVAEMCTAAPAANTDLNSSASLYFAETKLCGCKPQILATTAKYATLRRQRTVDHLYARKPGLNLRPVVRGTIHQNNGFHWNWFQTMMALFLHNVQLETMTEQAGIHFRPNWLRGCISVRGSPSIKTLNFTKDPAFTLLEPQEKGFWIVLDMYDTLSSNIIQYMRQTNRSEISF